MDGYLPDDVKKGIALARAQALRKRNRLHVSVGDLEIPVIKLENDGFTVDVEHAALRGLIDLYDGSRHLFQCLIIRADVGARATRYEFKRRTEAKDTVPVDYEIDDQAPVALLR